MNNLDNWHFKATRQRESFKDNVLNMANISQEESMWWASEVGNRWTPFFFKEKLKKATDWESLKYKRGFAHHSYLWIRLAFFVYVKYYSSAYLP